jgi:hypothetical protein
MTERRAFREKYQNQVAELGEGEDPPADEGEIEQARRLIQDDAQGFTVNEHDLMKARVLVERYETQLALIRRVQLRVCEYSTSVVDAVEVMECLGIAPKQAVLPTKVFFSPATMLDSSVAKHHV